MSTRFIQFLALALFIGFAPCFPAEPPDSRTASGETPLPEDPALENLAPDTGNDAGFPIIGNEETVAQAGVSFPEIASESVGVGEIVSETGSQGFLIPHLAPPGTGPVHIPVQIVPPTSSSPAPLSLGLEDAVRTALERNRSLRVKHLEVDLSREDVVLEKARFDGLLSGSLSNSDRLGKQIQQSGALGDNVSNRTDSSISLERKSPSGTTTTLGVTLSRARSARAANLFGTRLSLDVTHPLKRDAGRKVNLIAVRQAELDVVATAFELDAFVTSLACDVQKTYWSLYLAVRELEIFADSHRLALMQMDETRKKVTLGTIPESELAAAEAEVALREEDLINAQSKIEEYRIGLLRLINPGSDRFWTFPVELVGTLPAGDPTLPLPEDLVEKALVRRPEINQAKTLLEKGELELVSTRNGLLPKLDFFLTLGKSGYSKTLEKSASEIGMKAYDLSAGLEYEIWPGKRAAKARDRKARFSLTQQEIAIENLRQIVAEDVLTAYLEVRRATQQVHATSKTVEKQVEKLRVEQVKFGLGKTTSFQVAQAQRDVAASRISALKARIGLTTALIDLSRFDGTLCENLGITIER